MPKLFVVTRDGEQVAIDAPAGASVMDSMRNAGLDEVLALCGGCCSCATCHVFVDGAWAACVGPQSIEEEELLAGSVHRRETSRLSCQIRMTDQLDRLRVTLAPED